jgi:hypothetical protein
MKLTQKTTLAKIISKKFNLEEKEVRSQIDAIVEEIIIELSKGNTITHPGVITFTPVIKEGGLVNKNSEIFKRYDEDHIATRVSLSPKSTKLLKSYKLKNLDLL